MKQVIIRRSLLGNMLFAVLCVIFAAIGAFILHSGGSTEAVAALILSGIGGAAFFMFMAWKPLVSISGKGLTVPHGCSKRFIARGKNK